jgi:YHS domain-containing protein
MYRNSVADVLFRFAGACVCLILSAQPVAAQDAPQVPPPHDHSQMAPEQHGAMSHMREGSGTSWLPDASPMYAVHRQRGAWELMAHGNGFLQFLSDSGERGHDQFGSINWVMGMAHRIIGSGRVGFRGMLSLEPWTIRGCGYPDLLASGERCDGQSIHDQQHQHDLFMEIAAQYDRPLAGSMRWQVYGGPAAEPALGPVAYPHRVSAMPNLLAPITHHWLDATHITFGVVTGGIYNNRWKVEASAFNGREPDEERTDFDLAALDSMSARVWFLPSAHIALQFSAGELTEAEPAENGGPRIDVTRVTASGTYHRDFREGSILATTAAWGRNVEQDHASNALLVETNLTFDDSDTWFGRFEVVGKSAHDLDVPGDGTFTVGKLQGGYVRYLNTWKSLKPGFGVSASVGFVPESLKPFYGSRTNVGFGVFATLRPAAMSMAMMNMPHAPGAAPMDHSKMPMDHSKTPMDHSKMKPEKPASKPAAGKPTTPPPASEAKLPVLPADRIIDPACPKIDLVNAPRATYQGRVYYFCSTADRDEFVKDPAAYLKKRAK